MKLNGLAKNKLEKLHQCNSLLGVKPFRRFCKDGIPHFFLGGMIVCVIVAGHSYMNKGNECNSLPLFL
jgi:hypothetical protein